MITEIGGTVGDIESLPFLEAIRQFPVDVGPARLHVHPPHARALHRPRRRAEDQADAALGQRAAPHRHPARHAALPLEGELSPRDPQQDRAVRDVPASTRSSRRRTSTTSTRCRSCSATRASTTSSCRALRPRGAPADLASWEDIVARRRGRAAGCGSRSSASTSSSRTPTCRSSRRCATRLPARRADRDRLGRLRDARPTEAPSALLGGVDGILIPGGFGGRGIEGKIRAARFARERGIPYLGICLGMQIAVAEFARHVAGMDGANSTEFDPETPCPVIDLLPEQKEVADMGGTMRLGADPVKLHDGTRARELYGEAVIYERHRHRYEVNNLLRKRLEARRPRRLGHLAGRAPRRGHRAARPPVLRRLAVPPRVQVAARAPGPLFREFVARRARARAQRAGARRGRAGEPRERAPGRWPPRAGAARAARPSARGSTRRSPRCARSAARRPRARGADRVAAELRGLGLEVEEDDTAAETGAECGNLLARIARPRASARSCCAPTSTRSRTRAPSSRCSSTAAGRAPTTDPRRRQQGGGRRAAGGRAARARRGRAGRRRAAVHGQRGERAGRRQGVRRRPPALGVRLRLRPRLADRRGGRRLADLLPPRGRVPRRARPTPASGPRTGRSAIVAAAARSRDAPGRLDEETTANVGPIAGGDGGRTSCRSAAASMAEARSLDDAKPSRRSSPRWSTALTTAANAAECDVDVTSSGCSTATGSARRAAGRRARRRCAPAATRRADRHRRRVGRQRVRGGRASLPEPRQRHRAQPRARRARHRRRAGGDARRRARAARRGARRDCCVLRRGPS